MGFGPLVELEGPAQSSEGGLAAARPCHPARRKSPAQGGRPSGGRGGVPVPESSRVYCLLALMEVTCTHQIDHFKVSHLVAVRTSTTWGALWLR